MVAQKKKKNIQNNKQAVKHISTARIHLKCGPTV